MWGLGEVEEIFKTAPREHAGISPTVGVAKSRTRLCAFTFTFHFHAWEWVAISSSNA